MKITSLIYYSMCLTASAGLALIKADIYSAKLIRAGRWRINPDKVDLRRFPLMKPYFNIVDRRKRMKIDVEIYEAISYMRNLACIGMGMKYSSDTLIEQLILRKGILSTVYVKILQLLRQNQRTEAIEYFTSTAATKNARDFVRLLIKWDDLNPAQLQETLVSHQQTIREIRMTALKARTENISDLIYLPVVANIMLIFINFIYVGYFIDQREMLMMLL